MTDHFDLEGFNESERLRAKLLPGRSRPKRWHQRVRILDTLPGRHEPRMLGTGSVGWKRFMNEHIDDEAINPKAKHYPVPELPDQVLVTRG